MRISIFPNYGALNSKPVFESFVNGAKKLGHDIVTHDLSADAYVIWSVLWHGRMLKNYDVWCNAKLSNKPIIILEVGGLKRGTTWKIGLNHINNNGKFFNYDNLIPNRSKKLGINLEQWKSTGRNILVCGQHSRSEQWKGYPPPDVWIHQTISTIRKFTDRPIKVRPHPRDHCSIIINDFKNVEISKPEKLVNTYDDFNFIEALTDAWAVVNVSSNVGVTSVIHGVPAFVSTESLASLVGNIDISTIDDPIRPERETWLEQICHTEWTLDEISDGIPLKRLTF